MSRTSLRELASIREQTESAHRFVPSRNPAVPSQLASQINAPGPISAILSVGICAVAAGCSIVACEQSQLVSHARCPKVRPFRPPKAHARAAAHMCFGGLLKGLAPLTPKSVKSRARAAVSFSLEPKRSCANCVWLLSRLRTAALLKRIPFYNTVKQWRTLQKLALTSVDPSNTKFSFPSSLA